MSIDAQIQAALETEIYGRSLEWHESAASTMDLAHAAVQRGAPNGHVVIAATQTAGRGARGTTWHSPPGAHLYLSIVLRGESVEGLTLAAGLGVADAACALGADPNQIFIKWPNDIWIGQPPAKAAGLLAEARSSGTPDVVVLGIGLNLAEGAWPDEIDAAAVHAGVDDAACAVLLHLERRLNARRTGGLEMLLPDLRARLLWRGERVALDDHVGTLVGVDTRGAVVIDDDAFLAGRLRPAES